jgi:hypothetical protein
VLQINGEDFTKLCVYEYFPLAAEALWGQQPSQPDAIRENLNPAPAKLRASSYDLAKRYEDLPALAQQVVIALVHNLQGLVNGNLTGTRSVPVNRDSL